MSLHPPHSHDSLHLYDNCMSGKLQSEDHQKIVLFMNTHTRFLLNRIRKEVTSKSHKQTFSLTTSLTIFNRSLSSGATVNSYTYLSIMILHMVLGQELVGVSLHSTIVYMSNLLEVQS